MRPRVLAKQSKDDLQKQCAVALQASSPSRQVLYYFEAIVRVDMNDWVKFDNAHESKAGPMLVDAHQQAQLEIAHSSINMNTFTFYNYWKIGASANGLVDAELRMGDNKFIAEFDVSVQRDEVKHLLTPLLTNSVTKSFDGFSLENCKYLRVEFDVIPSELFEFQARLEAQLEPFAERLGWLLGDTYLHVTGLDGRVVQLWLVPNDAQTSDVNAAVEQMPWLKSNVDKPLLRPNCPPRPTLLSVTPFDPTSRRLVNS